VSRGARRWSAPGRRRPSTGWTAAIDGRTAEIVAADLIVRAVRWPPGRHVLTMTYDPPGVRLGWWLSAAGALLTAALAALAVRRARAAG